jgi:ankyrin repeat protein
VIKYFANRTLEWSKTRFGGRERNGATWLHLLATTGHLKLLDMFLEKGLDINSRDWAGNTVLHAAAAKGKVESVKILIDAGADVTAINDSGQTVLVHALERNKSETAIMIFDAVKALGGDVNANPEPRGLPPVFLAASMERQALETVKHFLSCGVNMFQKTERSNETLLHVAARCGNEDLGEFLVEQMESQPEYYSLLNNSHMTPLHQAIRGSRWKLAKLLISAGANLEVLDNDDKSPLDLALEFYGNSLLEPLLLRSPDPIVSCKKLQKAFWDRLEHGGQSDLVAITSLHTAGHIKLNLPSLHYFLERNTTVGAIRAIGKCGADFHLQYKTNGETPLHVAIRKFTTAKATSQINIIDFLVSNMTDYTIQTNKGDTVLHYAARFGDTRVVEKILEKVGQDVFEMVNKKEKTALHEAVGRNGNNRWTVQALMEKREKFRKDELRELVVRRKGVSASGSGSGEQKPGLSEMDVIKRRKSTMGIANGLVGKGPAREKFVRRSSQRISF